MCIIIIFYATYIVLSYFVHPPTPLAVDDASTTTAWNTDPVLPGLVVTFGVTAHRVADSSLGLVVGARIGTGNVLGAVQLVAVVEVDAVSVTPPVVLHLDFPSRARSSTARDGSTLKVRCVVLLEVLEVTIDEFLDFCRGEAVLGLRLLRPCGELFSEFVLVIADGTDVLTDFIDGLLGDVVDSSSGAGAVRDKCLDFLDEVVDPACVFYRVDVGGGSGSGVGESS